jgi:hypothetical protein
MFTKIRAEWCNLDITNKFLLLIGLVLLVELIVSIFLHATNIDSTTDAFFRLSLSSVLGYFLGGINTGSSTIELPIGGVEHKKEEIQNFQQTTYIRTIFVAGVCLICIATLVATTFIEAASYEAGLIQLRNIISTTLGFLISKANRRS